MTTQETDLSELLERAIEVARSGRGSGGPPADEVAGLIRGYYLHVPAEDFAGRADADVYAAFASHYRLATARPERTPRVRVFTPTLAEHGWSTGGHSVVEVVVDDSPFLVDSVTMELGRQLRDVHLLVHPIMDVERDADGALLHAAPVGDTGTPPASGAVRESWMHVEIDRVHDQDAEALAADLRRVLHDVRVSVEDRELMAARIGRLAGELHTDPPPLSEDEVRVAFELLEWLAEDHFTFLGYQDYTLEQVDIDGRPEDVLRAVPGTGLGILRNHEESASRSFARLPEPVRAKARERTLLVLAKANSRSTVHRPAYLDYVGVKTFGADGQVTGEQRFLGLFSSSAYTESLAHVPLLREKAERVLSASGFDPLSHAGKTLLDTLETYPRDELFVTPVAELTPLVQAAAAARERRSVRALVRRDTYERYVSVLVFLPRDRYNTGVRERFAQILLDRLGGTDVEFTVRINESTTARVHFVVRLPVDRVAPPIDTADLERRLSEASRSWRDDFVNAVVAEYGEEVGAILGRRYLDSFPEAYKEDYSPRTASVDLGRLEAVQVGPDGSGLDLSLVQDLDAGRGEARLKVYRVGEPLSLSVVLPMLSSMGVEVVDERPYGLEGLERRSWVYDFGLHYDGELPERARELVQDALRAVWDGRSEVDGFNALVLGAGLTWRQVHVLRAYAKYMRQGGTPFAQDSLEEALVANAAITRLLVELFEARFTPGAAADDPERTTQQARLAEAITTALDAVVSLDHDRILRSYLTHVQATLRTSFFARDRDGRPHDRLALKLDPAAIPDLPRPRPRFEIFVHSARVEGVHLRFGSVARGGLRWSDRRDDFRTEVLGLVKAQMVKNTVIVPVGAKGGFFAKQLPTLGQSGGAGPTPAERDAWLAEGKAAYSTFVRGLLDLTDNLVGGRTVPPVDVVRHDGDDTYLVVAADKGTATFSDLANEVAADYDYWLGDAFASGGSVGYDHKAMGITARGAWVSVQRHFRERGIDCQTQDFTCVGVGDMSGDVFGNGMLRSEHTRLVAAFDHRDIFLDPTPDAASSYAERQRLFDLPRSSWQDYDHTLLSTGGGVHSRSAKAIAVTDEVRAALGIEDEVTTMTPAELIRAILTAPVDLLWNAGIGTYVKGSQETHADAGDKGNDAIRVDGGDLRARCVGEGGNLGLTQAGRIDYARTGGAIVTDFIDNSAGVDTSDHEVNLKILLDRVVAAGDLTRKQRNALLAEMTDEVAALVLRDNDEQNLALANAAAQAPSLIRVHEDWMRRLEGSGVLSREVEGLPTSRDVRRRADRHEGLTQPELAVLLAWTKIVLADELLASDLPEDPYLDLDLRAYFPRQVREGFAAQLETHPLRREIIVTQVVNDLVNGAGMTYWPRLSGETGADAAELTRANFVAREIFGSLPLRQEVATLDHRLDAAVQTSIRLEMRTLVERASRWLLTHRRSPLDSSGTVELFTGPVRALMQELPDLLTGRELADLLGRRDRLVASGVPEDLALRVAGLPTASTLLGVVEVARRDDLDPALVARVHFALGERLGLPDLVGRIVQLPREDRWQTMARAALRADLQDVHARLSADVLTTTSPEASAEDRVAAWEDSDAALVARTVSTLGQICAEDAELARLSVGLRVVRGLLPHA